MFILTILPVPLPPDAGFNDKNPTQRLASIRGQIVTAEQRVRDLEALLTALILQQPIIDGNGNPVVISAVDNTDANAVRQELYRARAFEGELRTAEQFWNNIVESNKQAEKDTHDLFKRA